MGSIWDWFIKFQQPFPILCDETLNVFHQFGGYVILLDETMTIVEKTQMIDLETFRPILLDALTSRVSVEHTPFTNTENTTQDYRIDAMITSQTALVPDSLKLFWTLDHGSTFTETLLQQEQPDHYGAWIPAQPVGTSVSYYIYAGTENGQWAADPWTAPTSLHSFDIILDETPPLITHEPITLWTAAKWSPVITAQISDELTMQANLEYEVNNGSTQSVNMELNNEGSWVAEFTAVVEPGDQISYRIRATDSAITQHTSTAPVSGSYELNIVNSLPAAVVDLDQNHNSGPVIRDYLELLDLDIDYFQSAPQYPELYDALFICTGVHPNSTELPFPLTERLYSYLLQGGNIYLEGGDVWCDNFFGEFHRLFAINGNQSGEADTEIITGSPHTFTAGMQFQYNGDNNSMDQLVMGSSEGERIRLFKNTNPSYYNLISNALPEYKTIGSSFEFGGLVDGSESPSTKYDLMAQYANFFGLIQLPTPTPTITPLPTATPTPTPTCDQLRASITMPDNQFVPGSICSCTVNICNPGPEPHSSVPLFAVLECYDTYFFWPEFNNFAYEKIYLPAGRTEKIILPEFIWPAGAGSGEATWFSGMTNSEMNDLFGQFSSWWFSWSE